MHTHRDRPEAETPIVRGRGRLAEEHVNNPAKWAAAVGSGLKLRQGNKRGLSSAPFAAASPQLFVNVIGGRHRRTGVAITLPQLAQPFPAAL